MAAVDKIEDQRKSENFIGHRNKIPVVQYAKVGIFVFVIYGCTFLTYWSRRHIAPCKKIPNRIFRKSPCGQ